MQKKNKASKAKSKLFLSKESVRSLADVKGGAAKAGFRSQNSCSSDTH
jgi:hypothetical protein